MMKVGFEKTRMIEGNIIRDGERMQYRLYIQPFWHDTGEFQTDGGRTEFLCQQCALYL